MTKLTGFFRYYAKTPKKIILQPNCVVERLDVAEKNHTVMCLLVCLCVCMCVCVCRPATHVCMSTHYFILRQKPVRAHTDADALSHTFVGHVPVMFSVTKWLWVHCKATFLQLFPVSMHSQSLILTPVTGPIWITLIILPHAYGSNLFFRITNYGSIMEVIAEICKH
jgi:uncharacterized membrane protein